MHQRSLYWPSEKNKLWNSNIIQDPYVPYVLCAYRNNAHVSKEQILMYSNAVHLVCEYGVKIFDLLCLKTKY